ncbi:MAG: hypothetical protein ABSH04_06535 [Acidimicrobiales bacterium]|jgi:hypothetical protein
MGPEPDDEGEEQVSLPGDFETNLKAVLEVPPEAVEDGTEEPPQE